MTIGYWFCECDSNESNCSFSSFFVPPEAGTINFDKIEFFTSLWIVIKMQNFDYLYECSVQAEWKVEIKVETGI